MGDALYGETSGEGNGQMDSFYGKTGERARYESILLEFGPRFAEHDVAVYLCQVVEVDPILKGTPHGEEPVEHTTVYFVFVDRGVNKAYTPDGALEVVKETSKTWGFFGAGGKCWSLQKASPAPSSV